MEPFAPGEAVTLSDTTTGAVGRIVGVSDDGQTVDVHWHKRPGYEDQVTVEPSAALRRVHESEEGML